MRGRTNVTGVGELAINGDIKQFKVSEGTNVVAGDFVQYVAEMTKNKAFGYPYSLNNYFQVGNKRYVFMIGSAIALAEIGDTFNILSTNEQVRLLHLLKVDDENFLGFSSSEPYLHHFSVSGDQIVLSNSLTLEKYPTIDTYNSGFFMLSNGKVVLFCPLSKKGLSDYGDIYIFDVDNLNEMGYVEKIPYQNAFEYPYESRTGSVTSILGFSDDTIICASNRNIDSPSFMCARYKIDVENDYAVSFGTSQIVGVINQSSATRYFFNKKSFSSENYFLYAISYYYSYAYGDITFNVVNLNSGSVYGYALTDFGFNIGKSKISRVIYTDLFDGKKFAVCASDDDSQTYQFAIMEINADYSIRIFSNIASVSYSDLGMVDISKGAILYDENEIYFFYQSSSNVMYIKLVFQNDYLYVGKMGGIVKRYDGEKAIGVAKESGKSGEIIDVFVPPENP